MDNQKQNQPPYGVPQAGGELAEGLDPDELGNAVPDSAAASSNATDKGNTDAVGKDNLFDFDAFEDMLEDKELLDAMQQHQKKQAESQRQEQQKQEDEQKDIDELCSFTVAETDDADGIGEAIVVSKSLVPPHPSALERAVEAKPEPTDDSNKEPNPTSEPMPEPPSETNSDSAGVDTGEEVKLESFVAEDTGEQKAEARIDIESLSAHHLAMQITSDALYSLHAVKHLAQHGHLRAAIRNVRSKHESNLDFDRLAQLVDAESAPSKDDRRHLQAFEMALQKLLTNLFDYIYVIGKVGSDSEISKLVAVEYEDFFETMTGLTKQEFTQLCELGVFNGQELMNLINTFNTWCTKTMSAERFILYHANALQQEVG